VGIHRRNRQQRRYDRAAHRSPLEDHEEVKGAGVVGEQPVLRPGETFRYTSGTNMTTPSGIMTGTYRMVNEKGDAFDAEIPVFSLDSPYARRVLN